MMDLPKCNLYRGEIGAVVERYPNDGYEVESVALDGYTTHRSRLVNACSLHSSPKFSTYVGSNHGLARGQA
jgi:hypothetical protein